MKEIFACFIIIIAAAFICAFPLIGLFVVIGLVYIAYRLLNQLDKKGVK